MSATKILNHSDAGFERLAHQFKEKPKIEGLARGILTGFQDVEEALFQMLELFSVFTATGKQLECIGQIVGEPRRGRKDPAYRIAILAKIAINTSKGTPEDAIKVFSLITGATIVQLHEYFPGVVEIFGNVNFEYGYENLGPDSFAFDGGVDGLGFGDVFDPDVGGVFVGLVLFDVDFLYRIMDSVIPAGVRLEALGWFEEDPFSFDGDPAGKGFGDVFDVTVGGKFAKVVPV